MAHALVPGQNIVDCQYCSSVLGVGDVVQIKSLGNSSRLVFPWSTGTKQEINDPGRNINFQKLEGFNPRKTLNEMVNKGLTDYCTIPK
jgi:hypothetical protein